MVSTKVYMLVFLVKTFIHLVTYIFLHPRHGTFMAFVDHHCTCMRSLGRTFGTMPSPGEPIHGHRTLRSIHIHIVCAFIIPREYINSDINCDVNCNLTVFLIPYWPYSGGYLQYYQLIEYDIANDAIIDYGEDYISSTLNNSHGEYGLGVYYTQIDPSTLYLIDMLGDAINVYDLQSLSYDRLNTTIPFDVSYYSCIASSDSTLYITGGYSNQNGTLDRLQVLNLEDLSWLQRAPSMNYERYQHGCIVVNGNGNHKLWAIAGAYEESVEFVSTTDIEDRPWKKSGSLSCGLSFFGVTAFGDTIFIVGGNCYGTTIRPDTVYTIDSVTNSIRTHKDALPFGVSGMPVVLVGNTIYGFGGYDGKNVLDSWMTLDLLCTL